MFACKRRAQCVGVMRRMSSVSLFPSAAIYSPENLQLFSDVISEDQEKALIGFIDNLLRRKRYDKNHFDNVILNFRETEIYPEKLKDSPVSK
jgi:hypothetical protein